MTVDRKVEMGPCPVCNGTGMVKVPPERLKWQQLNALRIDDTHEQCRNCGGQTMSCKATGITRLRSDGTPCKHEYQGRNAGRCYTIYTCRHCRDSYDIDSSD